MTVTGNLANTNKNSLERPWSSSELKGSSRTVNHRGGRHRGGNLASGLPLDPASTLFVSLFLVLFAFFAVLNANAHQSPASSGAVMASLHTAFGDSEAGGSAGVSSRRTPSDEELGPALAEARRVIQTGLPAVAVAGRGNTLRLEVGVPQDVFFIDQTSRLAPSRELFIKALAEVARSQSLSIEIIFDSSINSAGRFQRLAALGSALGKYGLDTDRVSIVGTRADARTGTGAVHLVVREV